MPPPASATPPETVLHNRFLGFLIWQSIPSTVIFFLFKILSSAVSSASPSSAKPPFTFPFAPSIFALFTFFTFHLSQLLFSFALSLVSSPHPHRPASLLQLVLGLVRFLFVPGGSDSSETADSRARAKLSVGFLMFLGAAAVSGFVSVASLCGGFGDGVSAIGRVGFRGFVMGLLYGLYYVYNRRWVLEFPIIQRPPFFSFKMGLPSAITRSLQLSFVAYLFSAALLVFLPHHIQNQTTTGKFIAKQIRFYIGSFLVFLCWELSHHLHRVLHTKRFVFAPPKGSAAAETNPSEILLAALEESSPNSLLQYLAYLDLCMVCENNVDAWRRAAFFEETGETYKRVISVCLRPLEQLASKLGEGLESSIENGSQISKQLLSPTDNRLDSKYSEALNNFQLYAWCAWTAASLTACSHKEDRYGVAQISGSNAAVMSTLISCLLAVETYMGKKTTLQSANQFMGSTGFKLRNSSMANTGTSKKRAGPLHSKAYAVADVLRNSIYQIVSAFHDQMASSAKKGFLEKDWIVNSKPPFGPRELLVQKLRLFLDFRAS
ncbi:hypothetical protein ACFX2I_036321 [Malus domestica]|uniref:Nucleoporin protein Ndc1-Nup n=1 Tax=Malus domestica TaxID=3750 RepID=A0A498JY61_MALDO|nr:uncharacterized protein LOC103435204 [Malus domestica]XP_050148070.1 uncharacterized protein LOC126623273 [Malus sylvestris]RXH98923.1 hypothetical protein DVH24_011248 [Malus domestica]